MKRQPQANVTVLRQPHIAPDAVRVEIGCRHSTTGLTSIPGPRAPMTKAELVTAATLEHEARCGECDTTAAHDQGDQHIRAHVDQLQGALQAEMAQQYARGRRN